MADNISALLRQYEWRPLWNGASVACCSKLDSDAASNICRRPGRRFAQCRCGGRAAPAEQTL